MVQQHGERVGALFVAECRMPGMTPADLDAVRHALGQAGGRLSAAGHPVVLLGSMYVPGRGRWICVFQAPGRAEVRRAGEIAQVVFTAVEEIIELCPAV